MQPVEVEPPKKVATCDQAGSSQASSRASVLVWRFHMIQNNCEPSLPSSELRERAGRGRENGSQQTKDDSTTRRD